MSMTRIRILVATGALVAGSVAVAVPGAAQAAGGPAGVTVRVISGTQTTRLAPGTASGGELAPAIGPEAAIARAPVANRSESSRAKVDRAGLGLSGIPAASSAVTAAAGATSFAGINHHQQRLEVAGGNQWSLEPPDQALCVGNGLVFEAVNNAVAVYDTSGNRLALDSLNHFFGYPFEIDRTTGLAGPKQTTDPTCLYDPQTQRFFLTILTYDADTAGNPVPAGTNTLDTAVSPAGTPVPAGTNTLDTAVSPAGTAFGTWSITHIDATDDGTNGTPKHANCPCLGDYPHIGVDAHGFYVTTNEYPFFADGFDGSQI